MSASRPQRDDFAVGGQPVEGSDRRHQGRDRQRDHKKRREQGGKDPDQDSGVDSAIHQQVDQAQGLLGHEQERERPDAQREGGNEFLEHVPRNDAHGFSR